MLIMTFSLAFSLTLAQSMERLKSDHHTGNIHKYLGMKIDYYLVGKVELSMVDFLEIYLIISQNI